MKPGLEFWPNKPDSCHSYLNSLLNIRQIPSNLSLDCKRFNLCLFY